MRIDFESDVINLKMNAAETKLWNRYDVAFDKRVNLTMEALMNAHKTDVRLLRSNQTVSCYTILCMEEK